GNTVVDNSTNALFIRIDTPAGGTLQPLSVSGRWDDTDIVHMLAENLNIQGTPSGAKRESTAPAVSLVTRTAQTVSGGTLAAGNAYSYRIAMVDPNGYEGQSSQTIAPLTLSGAQNTIFLNRLPTANGEFVSRRLYRSTNGGTFQLVAELNADDVTYLDTGATLGGAISGLGVINRPRPDARLAIDPGVVVKLLGAKIEAEIGAQLIAEGTAAAPIIFTSLNNDQYGAGGSFDTDGGRGGVPLPGNWAGIYGGGFSTISLDHTLISYAGGETDLGGVPASFNAVETHQGKLRIANSILELNDAGTSGGGGNRDGHLPNGPAVIFVRGSQPILVNNVIRNNDNGGQNTLAAVSINANAMNADLVLDYGRSRGELAAFGQYVSNQGPLIRQNKLGGN
ncbi:MAG: hypothetical protein KDA55_21775, partial [Planctomycetales bacterium]|nr:hypothetical protein [Planctomycetales bacterium]